MSKVIERCLETFVICVDERGSCECVNRVNLAGVLAFL
ncbi:conserved hypothetical protein [Neorickettsia risticii str. Illinois]|uniref:Uncharacterized protein n=1 Tax=Neorickettsia risticii (strain Illinois) TaxID=434131 RepID=C6V624_NEORI|nr:conserved hypothetical protein [Neorickettsia risticii str. Illinois]